MTQNHIAAHDRLREAHAPVSRDTTVIHDRPSWRAAPAGATPGQLEVSRWQFHQDAVASVAADPFPDHFTVAIALRKMTLRLDVGGRTVFDGTAMPGLIHVTAPGQAAACHFHGPHDVLHLFIPRNAADEASRQCDASKLEQHAGVFYDATISTLADALLKAGERDGRQERFYTDAICTAILARLVRSIPAAEGRKKSASALLTWRLRRALDFIETHLADTITLVDLAATTGLTRMHFAAQFRAATGLRPHDYVTRRRIELAQTLLQRPRSSIVDVCLEAGFQTQSHFTTVFKRVVGQTPHSWRREQAGGLAACMPPRQSFPDCGPDRLAA